MKSFRDAIRTRDFAVTAECFLRPETDAESIRHQAELLRDSIDGVIVTDNQFGRLHMSALAAATLMRRNGIDPIMQLSCRNRNRIALLADLMGAAALNINNLLLVRGNRIPDVLEPRPKAVFDMTGAELIASAAAMVDDEQMRSPPDFFIGGLVTPHRPAPGWQPRKLNEKADAGARFMLTHPCLDMDLLRTYMQQLVSAQITRKLSVIATTAILTSAEDARWLRDARPNTTIPEQLATRIEAAADPEKTGFDICVEQVAELREIPGIAGVNIMATTDLAKIPQLVDATGLGTGATQ
ncbi:MAG: methylenetetrahydrofolate reductase [Gammaproteobacteria bacterium]|nr:methylenetetrahydrofolate reductase [Gammaproteobacteria bacterium]